MRHPANTGLNAARQCRRVTPRGAAVEGCGKELGAGKSESPPCRQGRGKDRPPAATDLGAHAQFGPTNKAQRAWGWEGGQQCP